MRLQIIEKSGELGWCLIVGLAFGIAMEMGRLTVMGLASAVFGPWMNISGSSLASIWKERKPKKTISV